MRGRAIVAWWKHGTRETKVCELQEALIVDEKIGALDVAMKNVVPVAKMEALQELTHVALDVFRLKPSKIGLLHETREVVVHVLEHQVDARRSRRHRLSTSSRG